jgi:hypothetical protein
MWWYIQIWKYNMGLYLLGSARADTAHEAAAVWAKQERSKGKLLIYNREEQDHYALVFPDPTTTDRCCPAQMFKVWTKPKLAFGVDQKCNSELQARL